jgi:hypothetical protein
MGQEKPMRRLEFLAQPQTVVFALANVGLKTSTSPDTECEACLYCIERYYVS